MISAKVDMTVGGFLLGTGFALIVRDGGALSWSIAAMGLLDIFAGWTRKEKAS